MMEVITYPKSMTWHLDHQTQKELNIIITCVRFERESLHVYLSDGRVIGVPLNWFPLLVESTQLERDFFQIHDNGSSIIWPEIGQQITLRELLKGANPCEQCWFRISYFK
jgi:DNA mismatch repair protein MutH